MKQFVAHVDRLLLTLTIGSLLGTIAWGAVMISGPPYPVPCPSPLPFAAVGFGLAGLWAATYSAVKE